MKPITLKTRLCCTVLPTYSLCLSPFGSNALDLSNLRQFSLLLPMLLRLFCYLIVSFQSARPLATRITVIWAYGSPTAAELAICHNWILRELQTSKCACLVRSCFLESVSKWHHNACRSQL